MRNTMFLVQSNDCIFVDLPKPGVKSRVVITRKIGSLSAMAERLGFTPGNYVVLRWVGGKLRRLRPKH